MKAALLLLSLALAAQTAYGHTYFQAKLVGAKPSVKATGSLEFITHSGVAYWALNLTSVEQFATANLVFGNANITSEKINTFAQPPALYTGTGSWTGAFDASSFAPGTPYDSWTTDSLQANIGLDHVWATVNNNATYSNTILLGKVNKVSFADIKDPYVQNPPIEE